MHKNDLLHIFLKKYQDNQLAGVYLAKYKTAEDAKLWVQSLSQHLAKNSEHPDLLEVRRDVVDGQKTKEYKVDSKEISQFLKFIDFRPIELKKKFIFLHDAHLLSEILSNKLLKTFEEIPPYVCLILLAPNEENLLQTVESRSIAIHLPVLAKKTPSDLHSKPLFEILAHNSKQNKNENEDEDVIGDYVDELLENKIQNPNFQDLTETLENLKHFNQAESFNNSLASRLAILKNR